MGKGGTGDGGGGGEIVKRDKGELSGALSCFFR